MHPLAEDPLIGQTVGGYVVEYALGEGALGLVYRVKHPLLNRHFAIKVLRPELADDAISSSNFTREAQTLSQLKHPAIIDIIGYGPLGDGRQFMVMEYLVGRTLERELLEEGRLEPERALKLCDEILDGLSAAHSVDVIHRDLKPSNVFLAKMSGGREVVKLLDFGLARQQPSPAAPLPVDESGDSSQSGIAGTPDYIAPEQATGLQASKQSDLYSFGVMLFRMLTGSLPFKVDYDLPQSAQILALMTKHVRQAPPTLHEAASDVHFPAGLSEVVADLLKKSPAERPSSADTVRKRLRRVFHDQDLPQQPAPLPPAPVQAPNPRPRRRQQVFVGGVVALFAALAGGWWWWGTRELGARAAVTPRGASSLAALLDREQAVDRTQSLTADRAPAPPAPPFSSAPPPVLSAPQPVAAAGEPEPPEEPLVKLPLLHARPNPTRPAAPCTPDAAWQKRARADLNELATRASTSTVELTLWAAAREGPLSAAIHAATSEAECRAVGRELETFKRKVTGR